jgi:hypothetical protein
MVTVIVAKEKIDCEHLLGQFVDESHYDILVNEDTDCYMPRNCDAAEILDCNQDCNKCDKGADENRIAFKFRKNFFSQKEQEDAYAGLRDAALPTQNRGLAAGPKGEKCGNREWVSEFQVQLFDYFKKEQENTAVTTDVKQDVAALKARFDGVESSRGLVWLASKVKEDNFKFDSWLKKIMKMPPAERKKEAAHVYDYYISDTTYANQVLSGIAGWYDRYPRIPYGRATSYTQHNYDKFKLAFPFLQSLNKGFKDLLPWRWGNQRAAADKIDQNFLVPETVFTTITVNKTFRTACHRDAGDFSDGLSNLLVLSNNGKYTGGYLVFPEYRIAVNVRPGDLLLVNNHEIIHGNTPIETYDDGERISLVCYLREGMLELGSKQYEDTRYDFVESRRKNKEHPLWRPMWNGVSEKMWDTQEWYDYLKSKDEKLYEEHIKLFGKEETSTLDNLWA